MNDNEKFAAALTWVEEELGGLCNVNRIDETNAEIDAYLVGLIDDGWAAWSFDEDGCCDLLADKMRPV